MFASAVGSAVETGDPRGVAVVGLQTAVRRAKGSREKDFDQAKKRFRGFLRDSLVRYSAVQHFPRLLLQSKQRKLNYKPQNTGRANAEVWLAAFQCSQHFPGKTEVRCVNAVGPAKHNGIEVGMGKGYIWRIRLGMQKRRMRIRAPR